MYATIYSSSDDVATVHRVASFRLSRVFQTTGFDVRTECGLQGMGIEWMDQTTQSPVCEGCLNAGRVELRSSELVTGRDVLIATMELAAAALGPTMARDLLMRHVRALRENPGYLDERMP